MTNLETRISRLEQINSTGTKPFGYVFTDAEEAAAYFAAHHDADRSLLTIYTGVPRNNHEAPPVYSTMTQEQAAEVMERTNY